MSTRRSSRRAGSKLSLMGFGAAFLIAGACIGGWFFFGGGTGTHTVDASIGDVLPPTPGAEAGSSGSDKPAISISQIDQTLIEVGDALKETKDQAHDAAMLSAYRRLCALLEGPLPVTERQRVIDVFHPITKELFLSSVHNEFASNYVAKGGDSFEKNAKNAGISVSRLTDLNNLTRGEKNLRLGQNLKLPKGAPRVVVSKTEFCASLYFGNNLVRQYIIAHGKNNNTPVGKVTIINMCLDPEKSARGTNDPVTEMKLRWIGLSKFSGERGGFGFHGTQYPDSIPGQTSKGCIRMRDEDVVELYDIVRPGNEVEIRA